MSVIISKRQVSRLRVPRSTTMGRRSSAPDRGQLVVFVDQCHLREGYHSGRIVSIAVIVAVRGLRGVKLVVSDAHEASRPPKVRGIDAPIPAKAKPIKSPVPLRRFRYDAKNDRSARAYRALRGPSSSPFFYSKAKD